MYTDLTQYTVHVHACTTSHNSLRHACSIDKERPRTPCYFFPPLYMYGVHACTCIYRDQVGITKPLRALGWNHYWKCNGNKSTWTFACLRQAFTCAMQLSSGVRTRDDPQPPTCALHVHNTPYTVLHCTVLVSHLLTLINWVTFALSPSWMVPGSPSPLLYIIHCTSFLERLPNERKFWFTCRKGHILHGD